MKKLRLLTYLLIAHPATNAGATPKFYSPFHQSVPLVMSYASAVLYGVSSDEKPVSPPKPQVQAPPKQQVQAPKPQEEEKREEAPQQPKVVLKLEGNDGGELGQLFRDEKNHVYTRKGDEDKKKNVKTDRIFDAVISYLEPVDVSALGRTCKYFLTKVTLLSPTQLK